MLVALGHLELDDSVLEGPGEPLRSERMRAAADGGFGEPAMVDEPWRVLQRDGGTAHVGARSRAWGGWVVLRLERDRRGRWEVRTSSYGDVVGPTRADRSAGLRLAWPVEHLRVARHAPWDLRVLLVNDGPASFQDCLSPHVVGHVDGAPELDEPAAFTSTGLELDLASGEQHELRVSVVSARTDDLPVGSYGLTAHLLDLPVRSPRLPVEVTAAP